jgi:ATP-binding cassette subfamily B protein
MLSLVVVLVIPLLVVFSARIRMLNLSYARKARRLYSMMAAFLTEHINGMEVNKATVQEGRAAADFRELTGQLKQASFKAAFYTAIYNPVVIIVGSVAAAGVVYLGGHLLFQPAYGISVGVLAAFFAYARSVFEPILDLTRYYAATQDSLSAGERIFSLIDEPVSIRDQAGALPFGKIRGHIRFENVDFHYHPDKPIIRNLNLDIRAGESVALVGPTGEGKSTLVSLICRFYEPTAGVIRIDGHDYKTKVLESYRSRLGIILQTPYLFSGTIADNVRYGKLGASRDEMREALELIGADDLAGRLDDQAGEEGNLLSAGEKQLISFARVILKDPDILLMDEATSSIDTLAELKIQRGIEKLIRGRTSVIIAHRLSTIRHCDRILVIRRGAVAEDGNHQQLMRKQGDYYELYSRQVREKGYAKEKLNQAQQG